MTFQPTASTPDAVSYVHVIKSACPSLDDVLVLDHRRLYLVHSVTFPKPITMADAHRAARLNLMDFYGREVEGVIFVTSDLDADRVYGIELVRSTRTWWVESRTRRPSANERDALRARSTGSAGMSTEGLYLKHSDMLSAEEAEREEQREAASLASLREAQDARQRGEEVRAVAEPESEEPGETENPEAAPPAKAPAKRTRKKPTVEDIEAGKAKLAAALAARKAERERAAAKDDPEEEEPKVKAKKPTKRKPKAGAAEVTP